MTTRPQKLSLGSTVALGIASMVGAGVFVVFREATQLAGSFLWLAISLAAIVAALNASSVFQLASSIDRPGGVYSYARAYLGDSWSFVAGFSFVFGKIGSIGAIALVLAEYLQPVPKPITAVSAILLMTLINVLGINRTAFAAKVLATITVTYLSVAALVGIFSGTVLAGLSYGFATGTGHPPILQIDTLQPKFLGLFPAAALMFFAFAGYARVATLGDEVQNAKRNIPRAIRISLIWVLLLYFAVAFALVSNFGAELAEIQSPFLRLLPTLPAWITQVVAVAACLGSILALLAGVSRTAATMAEDAELPKVFARRNRFGSPWLAEVMIAIGSILILQLGNLAWVIGFSSLSVLLYYAIGHLSALRQPKSQRKTPRFLIWIGFALCLLLLLAVPGPAVVTSSLILMLAISIRAVARRRRAR